MIALPCLLYSMDLTVVLLATAIVVALLLRRVGTAAEPERHPKMDACATTVR